MAKSPKVEKSLSDKIKAKLMTFHLPLILVLAIAIGIAFPAPGVALSSTPFTQMCVFMIFIISGLRLDVSAVKEALKYWVHFIIGCVFVLFITPVAGYFVLKVPITPVELKVGIAIMCCAPTVLASAAILADQCKGSFPLALLLSVSTNLLGVFVSPFTVSLLFKSSGFTLEMDVGSLLLELLLTIALPMCIGYAIQWYSAKVRAFVKKFGSTLKVFSSLFLCLVPWVKMSTSRDKLLDLDLLSIVYSVLLIAIVHFVFFGISYGISLLIRAPLPAMKALTLTCAMKTLPVAMTIISFLPESLGSPGIVLVPAILFHFFQLLSCSFITVRWTPKEVEEEVEEEEEVKDIEMAEHPVEVKVEEEKKPDVQPADMAVIPEKGECVTNDCYFVFCYGFNGTFSSTQ